MNYGVIRLDDVFLQKAYDLCHKHRVPVLADEIQSCIWYRDLFLIHEYGLQPDIAVLGKGFSGGEYAASRIATTYEMDDLDQFGALVTNGQEEVASLAYLVTMEFARENSDHVQKIGAYYEDSLKKMIKDFPDLIDSIEGEGLLESLFFKSIDAAVKFTKELNGRGIDISAQTYKPSCPPAVLTKLPLITTEKVVDFLVHSMAAALKKL
jgi:acetylornithine/succinyldiaminopimelate/putrescine aminotransferase